LGCFIVFSLVTLYKALSGADSCGCFGSVHVNPWITLLVIDLPAVVALAIFRPRSVTTGQPLSTLAPGRLKRSLDMIRISLVAILLAATTAVLALNEPQKTTFTYEVLEPETWIGKRLPILGHISIGKQLEKGNWLVLFYHHDCPDCQEAIQQYEHRKRNRLKIAFIEVPPYGQNIVDMSPDATIGKLSDQKEWFIATPTVVLLEDCRVRLAWERKMPDLDTVLLESVASTNISLALFGDITKGGDAFACIK